MPAQDSLKVFTILGRTDSAGATVTDIDQEELRFLTTALMQPGYTVSMVDQTSNPNAFRPRQNTGTDLNLKIGSGTTKKDGFVILGTAAGQGAYLIRLDATTKTISVPAADTVNPAQYAVFLHIDDVAYSGTAGRAYANVTCLRGTPSGSPVDPSPTATWSAYFKLWSFRLAANATAVTDAILDGANSTDFRVASVGTGGGQAKVSATTATIGPFSNVTTTVASVTTPISATRRYRVTYAFPYSIDTTGVTYTLRVDVLPSTTVTARQIVLGQLTSVAESLSRVDYVTGTAGTGIRVTIGRNSGAGNMTIPGTSANPVVLMVEDVGV